MMRHVVPTIAILCGLTLSACAPTRTLAPEDTAAGFNQRVGGQQVRIVTTDGDRLEATSFRLEADSVSWIAPRTGQLHTAAADSILHVETFSRRRGARRYAKWGMLVGGAIGATLGVVLAADTPALTEPFGGKVGGIIVWGLYAAGNYAGIGGAAGALVGVAVGDREVHDVPASNADDASRE